MADETVLLVGETDTPAEAALVSAACRQAGASCRLLPPRALDEALRSPAPPPPVVLFLPGLRAPLALARSVHAAWSEAFLLILRPQEDIPAFRRSMGVAPLLGRHWALAAATPAEVASALQQSLGSARQRRQLRTTLERANARLGETRAVESGEYQRLVASEHHLANFLRYSPAAVLGLDAAGRVLFWSEGAAQMVGIGTREALGRPLAELGAWAVPVARAAAAPGAGSERRTVEHMVRLRGEDVALEAALNPTGAGDARGTSIVLRDVTARRRAQDALREANVDLQRLVSERTEELEKSQLALMQAQKLEAIGKLTGGVAHDFNNVLQVIGSNLQLLQPLVRDRRDAERLLRGALTAVDRGAKLSSQLLAFARRQPLDPVPLNVGRKVREMDDLLRRALGEHIETEIVTAPDLWITLVDGNQLENVVLNLAINSRDAMPDGGKLTIEAANSELGEEYTGQVPDLAPGEYVMLAVSDSGHGMPADVVAQAFEPFFTTKPEGKGTGLGLSMAYGFAKQSGGHIRIYSEVGVGTTIKLYLPRTLEREVEPKRQLAGPVQGGSETILVVEDDLAVQAAVVNTLQSLGYRVLRASDAQAALTILQSGVHVDLLFTDVVMPGSLRSPELAERARQLLPGIAVLFTSGYTQNAIMHGGRLEAGVELLSKPYRQEDLARKLRQVLSDRQPHRTKAAAGQVAPPAGPPPATDAALHPPPEASSPVPGALRVLLVEDEAELREVSQQLLELLGCQVRSVASAEAAEAALREGACDLLITDFSLPGRNGVQLAERVRERHPGLQVVISSGYGKVAADTGAWLLPKPYGLPELEALIERAQAEAAQPG